MNFFGMFLGKLKAKRQVIKLLYLIEIKTAIRLINKAKSPFKIR